MRKLVRDRYVEGRSPRLNASEAHVLVPTLNISELEFVTEKPDLAEFELPSEEDTLMIEVDEGGHHRFNRRRNAYRSKNHFRDMVNGHRVLRKCGFTRLKRLFLCLGFVSVVGVMVTAFFILSLSLSVQMNYRATDCRQLALRARSELESDTNTSAPTPAGRRLLDEGVRAQKFLNFSGWDTFRLNQFRWMGTHNSYHLSSPLPIAPHHYSHVPLNEQLGWYDHGVRQVELDVHLIDDIFVVYHLHFVDDATTCYCLTQCLRQLREWSDGHPFHFPLFVFIEIKSKVWEDVNTALFGFSNQHLVNLEAEIVSVFSRDRLLTPDRVRGKHKDLRSPSHLNSCASNPHPSNSLLKVCLPVIGCWLAFTFGLFGEGCVCVVGRCARLGEDRASNPRRPSPQRKAVFYRSARPCQVFAVVLKVVEKCLRAYASVVVINDPREANYEVNVRSAVRSGLLVRTMSDSPNNLNKDPERFLMAWNSGAQILTTDFECVNRTEIGWVWKHEIEGPGPVTDPDYCESLQSGHPFECNPFNSDPSTCEPVTTHFFGSLSMKRPLWSSREGLACFFFSMFLSRWVRLARVFCWCDGLLSQSLFIVNVFMSALYVYVGGKRSILDAVFKFFFVVDLTSL